MEGNYSVIIDVFAERYFIKCFKKKYHGAWDTTLKTIVFQFERVDLFLKRDIAKTIVDKYPYKIIKSDFAVAGKMISPKSAGNRCISVVNEQNKTVHVLLVYSHTDIKQHNETVEWQTLIKNNYSQYKELL